jgi:ParB/RepB/Spo0J family partition protein
MVERKQIATGKLTLDSTQSRTVDWGSSEQDRRLVKSIENTGIMTALLVRPIEDASFDPAEEKVEYSIIAGSRRYQAAIDAGKTEVPCTIIHADDIEAAKLSYKENEERKDLTVTEKAQSIRLQYELLRPDELSEDETISCPVDGCEYEKDSYNGYEKHCGHTHPDIDILKLTRSPPTPTLAKKQIARDHFPEYEKERTAVKAEVKPLLNLAQMPPEVRTLFKDKKDRTAEEKELLRVHGVDDDRVLNASFSQNDDKAGSAVIRLFNQLSDSDSVDPAEMVLTTVAELDIDGIDQSDKVLGAQINDVADEITEELEGSESRDDLETIISDTVSRYSDRLQAQTESIDGNLSTRVAFDFDDNRYSVYHERYKVEADIDSNAEAVRQVYQEHLDELAEEDGWTN